MKSIYEILKDYTTREVDLEDANEALKAAGASFHLVPGRNEITEQDLWETVVGYYPEQASGWGLLDTGTGSLDKVHVVNGRLDYAVNEVLPDGRTNMAAYVTICGKTYEVLGDKLAELREDGCDARKVPPLPHTPDMRRRMDLAGHTVRQHTKTGDYDVFYDGQGYAVRAKRVDK